MGSRYAGGPPQEPLRLRIAKEIGVPSTEADRPQPGSGGIFGRRAGRRLRAGQTALMRDLLPRLEIGLEAAGSPAALFPSPDELRLEIGFGGGEHLAHRARELPRAGFIGCEPFRNGVAKLLDQAAAGSLDNIRLFIGDAGTLVDRLPPACLSGIDLLYPDPWPKRRQRKRRFISTEILVRLARVMKPGALLRFATDIDDYAGWTLARVLASQHFAWPASNAQDWLLPWEGWPSTRYEAKALRECRRPVYLTFARTDVPV